LKPHLRTTIETLLASGTSQHEIARRTGVARKTIRRYYRALAANSPGVATGSEPATGQTPPPRPPGIPPGILPGSAAAAPSAIASSACEPHRAWIEAQVQLGRNAMSLYQELVDTQGFAHRYNSVKRFVATLRARAPERFDVLEFLPGEEAQVDYGQGALTLVRPGGKYQRPLLFVRTLKYSGKSFRTTVWKTDQEIWAQLHEQAFHALGGCAAYVVLDNLRAGVVRPDLYEPTLNPVYAALLAHYGVVADPCRVRDPNRKGTVESAIQHTLLLPIDRSVRGNYYSFNAAISRLGGPRNRDSGIIRLSRCLTARDSGVVGFSVCTTTETPGHLRLGGQHDECGESSGSATRTPAVP